MTSTYDDFCSSSCLAFRWVADPSARWRPGLAPAFPDREPGAAIPVGTAEEVEGEIERLVAQQTRGTRAGIFLSAGMDSAILASFLPPGTPAFTIDFSARGAVRESERAAVFAARYGLEHHIVPVSWADYLETMDDLMRRKQAPLHAVEVALFKAARLAASMGVQTLVLGNGADSTFGGLDKLLSRDWTFDDFVKRYTFVDPRTVLATPADIRRIYEPYRNGTAIDYVAFLKEVHGFGVIQAFENAIGAAGCAIAEPFEDLKLSAPLDLARIRSGDSKYIIRELFRKRYPGMEAPDKIPFARPMDEWLAGWGGPRRAEFASFDAGRLTGDQKWIVYCLERFMAIMERQ